MPKKGDSPNIGISKSRTACKRCRQKKIKCDQEFPSCKRCAKLKVPCVSLDPATGKDVPRSYVFFLEDRLTAMMRMLKECGVDPMQVRGNIPATSEDEPCDPRKYDSVASLGQVGLLPYDGLLADYLVQIGHSMKPSASDVKSLETPPDIHEEQKKFPINPINEDNNALLPETGSPMTSNARAEELHQSNKEISALAAMKESSFNSFWETRRVYHLQGWYSQPLISDKIREMTYLMKTLSKGSRSITNTRRRKTIPSSIH